MAIRTTAVDGSGTAAVVKLPKVRTPEPNYGAKAAVPLL
jgi:hypothetical protein